MNVFTWQVTFRFYAGEYSRTASLCLRLTLISCETWRRPSTVASAFADLLRFRGAEWDQPPNERVRVTGSPPDWAPECHLGRSDTGLGLPVPRANTNQNTTFKVSQWLTGRSPLSCFLSTVQRLSAEERQFGEQAKHEHRHVTHHKGGRESPSPAEGRLGICNIGHGPCQVTNLKLSCSSYPNIPWPHP